MDLNWNDDGYHRLLVTFSYTYWKNNSLQAIGMELIDQGLADFSSISDGLGPIAAIGGADRGSMPIVDSPTTEGWIDPTLYEGGLDNSDLMGDIDNWDLMNPIGGDTPNEVSFENQNTEENNFGLDNSELIGDIDNFDLQ